MIKLYGLKYLPPKTAGAVAAQYPAEVDAAA